MGKFEAIVLSSVDLPVTVRANGNLLAVHGSQEPIETSCDPFVAQFPNMSDMVHLNLFLCFATNTTGFSQLGAGS